MLSFTPSCNSNAEMLDGSVETRSSSSHTFTVVEHVSFCRTFWLLTREAFIIFTVHGLQHTTFTVVSFMWFCEKHQITEKKHGVGMFRQHNDEVCMQTVSKNYDWRSQSIHVTAAVQNWVKKWHVNATRAWSSRPAIVTLNEKAQGCSFKHEGDIQLPSHSDANRLMEWSACLNGALGISLWQENCL